MKIKLLLGSIGAVAILILVSFINAVGYQSVKSTTVPSPLFNVRTQRATNQQQNIITSQYLGMGKENELKVFISSRNNERILLQKALNRLYRMDDATFTKFIEKVLFWVSTQDEYKDVNVSQLIIVLHQIKENPTIFEKYVVFDNSNLPENGGLTIDMWFPGCLIFRLSSLITDVLLFSIFFIWIFFSIRIETCDYYYTCGRECW